MTSIPVNNAKSMMMDFAAKAPDKVFGTGETGSFTDVLSKQTESNQPQTQTGNVQAESATKTQTKVTSSTRDRVKNEEVSNAESTNTDNMDKVKDAALEAGEEIVKEIAEELNVTEEEVLEIMEVLGLTMVDLLQPENLMAVVMEASGETDPMALLTNAELGDALKNLTQFVQNLKTQMQAAFTISEEQLDEALTQVHAQEVQTAEMVETDAVSTKQPEIIVEDLTDGEENVQIEDDKPVSETESKPVEVKTTEVFDETVVAEDDNNKNGHQTGGNEAKGQDTPMNQNVFAQNLNQNISVQNAAVNGNVSFAAQQTQEIMNQIMDYMKVQIKPEMTQLEMQLNPESLGNVNVHIASKEGVITAQFTAQNETVKAAIESQLIQLKETFTEQGVKVEAIEVSVQANGFRQEYEDSRGGESAGEDDKKKSAVRRINLSNPELHTEDELSEEEQLAVSMMEANGNTVDYTA